MITPEKFVQALKNQAFTFFTGVPCSFFQSAINCVIDDKELSYLIVPNEGSALALAAGASMGGCRSVVMIQNAGLGNLINPLTSLNMIYRLPTLLFISGRAYGIPDEPQHEIMGKTMGSILDAIGIYHKDLPQTLQSFEANLKEASDWMKMEKLPFVFFVHKETIGSYAAASRQHSLFPMKRIDAIKIITEELSGGEYLIATTGKPSRELFSVYDRPKNFYMQGSMGHAPAIGLGLALYRPQEKIIILDGDGALLMHMGILSSIGHYKPENLYHLVLDNESYETTGDQDTTSRTTDFVKIALANGYRHAEEVYTEKELRSELKQLLKQKGPVLLRVKINRLPTPDIPRISSKHSSPQIAQNFMRELK